ncbi:type II secretion system protein G [beta proteobacterium AAP99]|nr:type II secretion system protein G [beta proteobacterium AAP99]
MIHLSTRLRPARGFTLIELLIVLAIVALLLSLALPRYLQSMDTAREALLKENLQRVRVTLQRFYGDTGRYPESLEELVERRYLNAVPIDPVTNTSNQWVLISPEGEVRGRVADVRSGAPGATRDGRAYREL